MVYPAEAFSMRQFFQRAQALYQARRPRDAAAVLNQILARAPDFVPALHFAGRIALECGRPKAAVPYLTRAADLAPDQPSVINDCAVALSSSGDSARAAEMFRALTRLQPDNPDNYRNLGLCLIGLDLCDEAIPVLKKYAAMVPEDSKGHVLLNSAYSRAGRLEEGMQECELAVKADPADLGAQMMKGQMLLMLGRPEDALPAFVAAEKLKPDFAGAIGHKGMALIALGQFDEARAALKKALSLQPMGVTFLNGLLDMGRFQPGDDRMPFLKRAQEGMQTLSREDQTELHLAIGKVESDLGHPKLAMAHWKAANAVLQQDNRYDEAGELRQLADIAEVFSPEYLRARRGGGVPSDLPVFIVGMPRSGTTLIEQVLASHSGVCGIGEGPYWNRLVQNGGLGKAFPAEIKTLPENIWQKSGAGYLKTLKAHDPDAIRITDKQPGNFRWLGVLHLSLPQAKFIYVHRNPADCALSCYSKKFTSGYGYIYNLSALGRYMRACEKLMAHWKKVLPPECILDVQYEDLVHDFEPQARRMLKFIGLEWEDSCARFFDTKRVVVTASMYAARQPLSAKSIGRAEPYHALMQDFFENYNKTEEQL